MAHDLTKEEYSAQVAGVWRATVWLSVITIAEVVAALMWPEEWNRYTLNFGFIALSLLKAYFIVGEFMHVKYEKRALALTILVPTVFLVWFIIAFLWEGAMWLDNREIWEVILEQVPSGGGHGGGHH